MTSSSPLRLSVWERSRSTVPGQSCAPGLAFALAVAAEFRRAIAASERYEHLKRTARACDDPEASPARRVYMEFYRDR
jgi:hypothetical protein